MSCLRFMVLAPFGEARMPILPENLAAQRWLDGSVHGVNGDFVCPVLLGEPRARSAKGDHLGFPLGHVAIDAVCFRPGGWSVLGRGMASGTASRHRDQVPLDTMDIVAGGTRHRGTIPVALALPQQAHLIAVDIGFGAIAKAGMAGRTERYLRVPIKLGRIAYGGM